jgi:hypothetical protein
MFDDVALPPTVETALRADPGEGVLAYRHRSADLRRAALATSPTLGDDPR